MKCYIDITLLPNPEIPLYFIWQKVYQQLHLAMVEIQDADGKVAVGVAFPEYDEGKRQLGSKLRLLATSQALLEQLNIQQWMSRLSDYIHITSIREIPDSVRGYAFYKRIQPKSSNARLARRKAKREGISYEQALSNLGNRDEQFSKAPYIQTKSHSSDKKYRLIVGCYEAAQSRDEGGFSTYGLSLKSTVPLF